ncbi:MAG TPA: protein kinase [Phycisphaerales bacterium]|nr:protein kinase [Phycisphaerales bacterium]
MTDSWDRPPPGSSGALGSDPDRGEAPTIAPWQSSFGGQRITAGKNIGPYPIERELGRGGMGVVYLAKDTRLNRRVAIKVLPDVFAQHPERAARFRREAQLLASLNHPNIAGIYGLEEHEGHHYIVMEFVPGDTLSERLTNGPLGIDDAVHISAQIAEGLEAAHERGVIHRDLKPGNVKITPEGLVKVLDFGLAKSSHESSAVGDSETLQSASLENTQEGVILGTAAYMSPEQARGRTLDKRTDVWSFGCVLYETLVGAPPFRADTISDTIALILRSEPDWAALPADTPGRVREVLRKCLQKDPKRRLRDLGDARIELHDAYGALSGSNVDVPSEVRTIQADEAEPSPWLTQLPWIVAGLALALAATLLAIVLKGGPPAPAATAALPSPASRSSRPGTACLTPPTARVQSRSLPTAACSCIARGTPPPRASTSDGWTRSTLNRSPTPTTPACRSSPPMARPSASSRPGAFAVSASPARNGSCRTSPRSPTVSRARHGEATTRSSSAPSEPHPASTASRPPAVRPSRSPRPIAPRARSPTSGRTPCPEARRSSTRR